MLTSPDNIWTPDTGTEFKPTIDLATMADSIQATLTELRELSRGRLISVNYLSWATLADSGTFPNQGVSVWGEADKVIASIQIPDPGVPYRVQFYAHGYWGRELDSTGARYDFDAMVGSTTTYTKLPANDEFIYSNWRSWSPPVSAQTFTGSQTVAFRARRITPGNAFGAVRTGSSLIAATVFSA